MGFGSIKIEVSVLVRVGVRWGLGVSGNDCEAHSWSQKNINLNAYFSASGERENEPEWESGLCSEASRLDSTSRERSKYNFLFLLPDSV